MSLSNFFRNNSKRNVRYGELAAPAPVYGKIPSCVGFCKAARVRQRDALPARLNKNTSGLASDLHLSKHPKEYPR